MIHAAAAQPSGGSASTAAGRPGRGLSRPLTRKQLARLAAVQLEDGAAVMARLGSSQPPESLSLSARDSASLALTERPGSRPCKTGAPGVTTLIRDFRVTDEQSLPREEAFKFK